MEWKNKCRGHMHFKQIFVSKLPNRLPGKVALEGYRDECCHEIRELGALVDLDIQIAESCVAPSPIACSVERAIWAYFSTSFLDRSGER